MYCTIERISRARPGDVCDVHFLFSEFRHLRSAITICNSWYYIKNIKKKYKKWSQIDFIVEHAKNWGESVFLVLKSPWIKCHDFNQKQNLQIYNNNWPLKFEVFRVSHRYALLNHVVDLIILNYVSCNWLFQLLSKKLT